MNSNIDFMCIFAEFIAEFIAEEQKYAEIDAELQRDRALIAKIYNYIFPIILSEYNLSASNAYAEMSIADIDIYLKYKYAIIIKFNAYCKKYGLAVELAPKNAII